MSYAKDAEFDTVETYARIGASIELFTKTAPFLLERAKTPVREVQGPRRQRKVA